MFCKARFAVLATAAVILLVAALSASGTTWDPAAQWSITNGNPNGVWTYGYYNQLGGSFTTNVSAEDRGIVQVWVGVAPSDAGLLYNPGAERAVGIEPHQAALHPGSNGTMPTYRWTATGTMFVDVQATYNGCAYTTTDVHVLLNGTSLFDGVINGYSGTPPDYADVQGDSPVQQYAGILAVNAGDTIDFTIGYGTGGYSNDLTGIAATITTTTDVGTVSGTVKDSFDNPLAGATLTVDGQPYSAKTGADGSYTLLLPAGSYDVHAAKAGFEGQSLSATVTVGGTTTKDFVLGNMLVTGTVLSSLTGNPPLAGATVKTTTIEGTVVSTTTGQDGKYSLSLVLPGYYFIEASFPGYDTNYADVMLDEMGQSVVADFTLSLIPGDSWDAAEDFGPSLNPNNVWSYGHLTALDGPFTLYADYFSAALPTGVLAGWVLDNDPNSQGSMIQNVSLDPYDGNPYYYESMQLVPHPGPGGRMATVRWTAPQPMWINIDTQFTGQMMDWTTTDVHVTKSGVSLFDGAVNGFAGTAANGYADVAGTSPRQSFMAVAQVALGDTIDFVVGPGPDQDSLHDLTGLTATISAITEVGTLTGHVMAGAGTSPVAGAVITTVEQPYSTVTQADGSYTLDLPAGIWHVTASHPLCDEQTALATVTTGNTTTQDFHLPVTKGEIVGQVTLVNGSTSVPAAYAKVACPSLGVTTHTDAGGSYSMVLPVSGTVSLVVTHPGAVAPVTADVAVPENTAPLTKDFALTARTGGPFTYYVKPGGDDDANGLSEATAWASIDNGDVTAITQPGDTVIVKAGTYDQPHVMTPRTDNLSGFACLTRSGTVAAPITYMAEPGVVIDGQGSSAYGIVACNGCSYNVIKGFEVKSLNGGIALDGAAAAVVGVTVEDCVVHGTYGVAIQFINATSFKCQRCVIYGGYRQSVYGEAYYNGYWLSSGSTGTIYNCLIDGTGEGALQGVRLDDSSTVVVKNSIFMACGYCALRNRTTGDLTLDEDYNTFYLNAADFSYNTTHTAGAHDQIAVDPMFVNAAANDYHLATGSPCIDTGLDVGLPFSGTAPDRGAFEVAGPIAIHNLRDARGLDAGALVSVEDPQVATAATGTFTDTRYYLEDPDRTAGMMVIPASGLPAVTLGARVTLTGAIAIDANGEKYIAASAQTPAGGAALTAVGVGGKALAGCQGLLVRVWGKVTQKTSDYVTVDDGSLLPVRIMLSGLASPITKTINVGDTISVGGLAGLASGGVSAVRPRGDGDIKVY